MKSALVTEIMTKNVVCVSPEQKIIDVKHIYEKEQFHHHIPVTKKNKIVGMVSLIDFMYHIRGAGLDDTSAVYNELKVKDIMSMNPYHVPSTTTIKEVAEKLSEGAYHAIPIVDEGRVVGIISTADLIKYFLKKMPN